MGHPPAEKRPSENGPPAENGPRYERVRFTDGDHGPVRSVILRIEREGDLFLRGVEVNREGDEVSGPGWDRRVHLIDRTCIRTRRRLVMDNHYGWLVPA